MAMIEIALTFVLAAAAFAFGCGVRWRCFPSCLADDDPFFLEDSFEEPGKLAPTQHLMRDHTSGQASFSLQTPSPHMAHAEQNEKSSRMDRLSLKMHAESSNLVMGCDRVSPSPRDQWVQNFLQALADTDVQIAQLRSLSEDSEIGRLGGVPPAERVFMYLQVS